MTRALLVGAVSTADKDQDPESQLRPLREAATRKGWTFEEMRFKQSRFDEESYREVREAILDRLRGGGFDVLAVWAWDRLSRQDVEEAFRLMRELEDHLGVRFFSLQEPFLSTEGDRAQRELLLPIITWVANQASKRASARLVEKGKTKRVASAKLGQRAKWGSGHLATPEQVDEVRRLWGTMSERALAARVGLSRSQTRRIGKGDVKSA